MDFPDGFNLWLVILKHNDLVFVVVFSLNLHSVASYLWCSLEVVVCTSDSFSILLGFCCAILLVTVSSSTRMWFGWNMLSSFARIKKMLEVSNKGPKWKYQFVLSLYSRLSKFDLAIITWLPYCFRKFGFDIWLIVSFNLQIYHPIGSKDHMYMSSECSKNVNACYIYMNWSYLDLSVYYSTYYCPWLHLVCLCI